MPWLPREEALAQYQWADVLVFTSLRDASGSVVMESLSQGLPVICLDHQGIGDIVTAQCGIKVPVTSTAEVVQRLSEAIIALAQNRERLDELAVAALERARAYLWGRKVEQTAEIYRQVLTKRLDHAGLPL
jgi:glycosyltransferase involved in cell wall biosynthesis